MEKITLRNDFHDTKINLIPNGDQLSAQQIKRAKRTLCPVKGCCCSGFDGTRGPQEIGGIEIIGDQYDGDNFAGIIHDKSELYY
jgi:hypothetical protein